MSLESYTDGTHDYRALTCDHGLDSTNYDSRNPKPCTAHITTKRMTELGDDNLDSYTLRTNTMAWKAGWHIDEYKNGNDLCPDHVTADPTYGTDPDKLTDYTRTILETLGDTPDNNYDASILCSLVLGRLNKPVGDTGLRTIALNAIDALEEATLIVRPGGTKDDSKSDHYLRTARGDIALGLRKPYIDDPRFYIAPAIPEQADH